VRPAVVLLIAVTAASWATPFLREANSRAATKRGIKAFAAGQFAEAANDLGEAAKLRPGTVSSLNAGTASVAAGDFEKGMAALGEAAQDPQLREQALFNRGTAMLASHQNDRAIADLEETLRINPGSMRAKRNLEIALRNKQKDEGAGGGKGQQSQQPQDGQQEQQGESGAPNAQQKPAGGEADIEAILESVAQQEKEELRRMRRRGRPDRGIANW
jgi:tetratricopeptide (TPR) repeat protein